MLLFAARGRDVSSVTVGIREKRSSAGVNCYDSSGAKSNSSGPTLEYRVALRVLVKEIFRHEMTGHRSLSSSIDDVSIGIQQ